MNKEKPTIFLSYAREDIGMAKKLYNDLKRYGLDVWLDTELLLPGDRWKDNFQDAIENSNYFAVKNYPLILIKFAWFLKFLFLHYNYIFEIPTVWKHLIIL